MNNEPICYALENREFCLRYMWRLFAHEPDEGLLALVADETTHKQIALLAGSNQVAVSAQEHLAHLAGSLRDEGQVGLSRLCSEYTRLFIGPARPVAPLWESVYRDPEGVLFSQTTADVRAAYAQAGFSAAGGKGYADDHLAIEFNFMAACSRAANRALANHDTNLAARYIRHQVAFYNAHINVWIPDVLVRLQEDIPAEYSDFYLYAATLAVQVCKADSLAATELQDALHDLAD